MIHLYALTHAGDVAPELTGIRGRPVTLVDCGRLRAIVTEHERVVGTSTEAALAHAAVISAICEQAPALPIRYGVTLLSPERLRETIAQRECELRDVLERVGNHVEFAVRPVAPLQIHEPPGEAPAVAAGRTPGRAYLEGRLAQEQSREQARRAMERKVHEASRDLCDRAAAIVDRHGRCGPERSFLVHRAERDSFIEQAAMWLEGEPGLLLGGPWPPYTFAGEAVPA